MTEHCYAIVAGGDINGLGVVRSLARSRIPVVVLDDDLTRPTMRTRFGRKHRVTSLEGDAFVTELGSLRRQFKTDPVLFLTQEKSVVTVSEAYAAVSRDFRIAMPGASIMRTLMDKASFQDAAEKLGFLVPRAVTLERDADLAGARSLRYPCVMKPVVKSAAYDRHFKKAYKLEGFAEVAELFMKVKKYCSLIVQEWVEGDDGNIFFCLQYCGRDHQPVASFVGRKLRSWPPRVGGTASCMAAVEEAPELERATTAFFSGIGFIGMGSMEYKRDARSGRYYMIEPTVGRTDFQEEVATLNGINIPAAAYRYEVGERVTQPARAQTPTAWTVSRLERWAREAQPESGLDIPRGIRRCDAVQRGNDPLPWLVTIAQRLKARVTTWRGR